MTLTYTINCSTLKEILLKTSYKSPFNGLITTSSTTTFFGWLAVLTMMSATSTGESIRFLYRARIFESHIGVSILPGRMFVILMLNLLTSSRSEFASASNPAFEAAYTELSSNAELAATERMLMMCPLFSLSSAEVQLLS